MEATENERLWSPRSTQDFSPRLFVESQIEQDQANSDFRKFHSQSNQLMFLHIFVQALHPLTHINVATTE
eukprot:14765860-Ditylum_brightwellii.AAC.1